LLRLAVVVGYVLMMMASLFGMSTTRAQVTPSATVTPTPAGMLTPVASKLTVKPGVLSFGFEVVLPPDGTQSKPKSIKLSVAKNQPQPVTIEQPLMVSDSSGPPAQFTVQANNCTVIQPGGSCTVQIVFQPNGMRRRNALLLITSNASNGVQSVGLIGHGKQGSLTINPGALGFPAADVGTLPTSSKQITLTNKNPVQITIHGITSSNQSVFPITENCPTMLQPSASCTISVSFMADRNGAIGGFVNVADNAAGPHRVKLSGVGRGGPRVTRTPTPTRTPKPTATFTPGLFPMRAFPAMH